MVALLAGCQHRGASPRWADRGRRGSAQRRQPRSPPTARDTDLHLRSWRRRRSLLLRSSTGKLSSVGLPEGFDLKHNGYLVVPPSLHPDSGDPYSWVHRPVAACPANLRRAIVLPPARPGLPPRLPRVGLDGSHLVAFVARQPEGNVNNGLFWAACRAAEAGFDIGEALIAAAVYAGHPESGARRTVASAARKAHA